jgi:hypothetical protein
MTQQEAAEAISRYTEAEWTQATMATAEGSVSGARIRQFTPSELLAFCFVFDVPIGWFFMPPSDDEAEALEMAKHSAGIGWKSVFRAITPTEGNLPDYLSHQRDWVRRSESFEKRPPFHEQAGRRIPSRALGPHELATQFVLGLFQRSLGGSRNLKFPNRESQAKWFGDMSGHILRLAEIMSVIGGNPSPDTYLQKNDEALTHQIWDELHEKYPTEGRPNCAECGEKVQYDERARAWTHAEGVPPHVYDIVPVL